MAEQTVASGQQIRTKASAVAVVLAVVQVNHHVAPRTEEPSAAHAATTCRTCSMS